MTWLFALLLGVGLSSSEGGPGLAPERAFHSVCSPDGETCADLDPEAGTTRAYPADRPQETLWEIAEWFGRAALADGGERFYAHEALLVPAAADAETPILRIFESGDLARTVTLGELLGPLEGLERHGTEGHVQWGLPIGLSGEGCFELWTADRELRCFGVE
jgi:hypothetical protein